MESSKVIHAIYNDDDILMSAVKKVKAEKHHIEEVYTPFGNEQCPILPWLLLTNPKERNVPSADKKPIRPFKP